MRNLLVVILSMALLAVACGSEASTTTAESITSNDSPASDDVASSDAASSPDVAPADAEEDAGGEPDPVAAPASATSDSCGYEQDLTADRIEVAQIPGDGRDESTRSALSDSADPSFDEPLIDISRILNGGPPPDGIPPIDAPVFQTAATVNWLQCNEPVSLLSVNGETRAYPVQIMTWHELVNDTFGDVPITLSYCPLCNSSLAYRRDIGDRTVTFGTSGRLFNSSLVMYDRETESLWTHFNGKAVVGTLVGAQLELLPMQTTSWASFLESNPEGLVLTRETGHDRRYGQNPYSGYDDVTTTPFLLDVDADPRLPAKERIVGIRRGSDSVAVVLESLADAGVLRTEVDNTALSVWHLPGTASALEGSGVADGRDVGAVGVYLPASSDGQDLTFAATPDGTFTDAETGSTWNIQGRAIDGSLAGTQLEQVEHLDTFWFALAAFEPDTRIVTAP